MGGDIEPSVIDNSYGHQLESLEEESPPYISSSNNFVTGAAIGSSSGRDCEDDDYEPNDVEHCQYVVVKVPAASKDLRYGIPTRVSLSREPPDNINLSASLHDLDALEHSKSSPQLPTGPAHSGDDTTKKFRKQGRTYTKSRVDRYGAYCASIGVL